MTISDRGRAYDRASGHVNDHVNDHVNGRVNGRDRVNAPCRAYDYGQASWVRDCDRHRAHARREALPNQRCVQIWAR